MKIGWAAEDLLHRAITRLRTVRFFQLLGWLGVALCALETTLAVLVDRGVVRSVPMAALALLGLLAIAMAAGIVVIVVAWRAARPRAEVAAAVERASPELQDRLNTLVFLETGPARGRAGFFHRIEQQIVRTFPVVGSAPAYSARPAGLAMLAFAVALVATVALNHRLHPWDRLSWAGEEERRPAAADGDASTFAPPVQAAEEVHTRWGEVRITEPGHDIKATKVDVVALQVEAATEEALSGASWSTAVNGGKIEARPLPKPSEPHYAVYRPQLALDEMHLSDWDLVSYSATATTAGPDGSYGSDIYFIEVRPFREEIARLPGGEGGKAFSGLNDLTGLIDEQRRILRETHRFLQKPPTDPTLRRQDRRKLADAEKDLADQARREYAKLAAEQENQPIGDMLTRLDRARERMRAAAQAVEQDSPDAQPLEQEALAELVATRKAFQKFVSEHPDAFDGAQKGGGDDDEDVPVAGLDQRLEQILELRDARKAARELVDKAAAEQKRLAEQAARTKGPQEALATEQEKLKKQLQDLRAQQPQAFKGAEPQADEAASTMGQSAKALRKGEGPEATQGAAEAVQRLQGALAEQGQGHELGDAYRLKEAVDREAERLRKMGDTPERYSPQEAEGSAANARKAARGLKDVARSDPGRALFGPELEQATNDAALSRTEKDLDAVANAASDEARGRAAGAASRDLKQLSHAFEQSEPEKARALRENRLKPSDEDALQRALDALDSMLARAESGRPGAAQDAERQRKELLLDLERGLQQKGAEARGRRILLLAQDLLGKDLTPAERVKLKKLKDEIASFQADLAGPAKADGDKPLTHVDPAQLPAAYRDRIQRYFQKLSEGER